MAKFVTQRVKKLWTTVGLLSAELLLVVVLFITALIAFAYLIRRVIVLHQTQFDEDVFAFLNNYVSPATTDFMLAVTFLGTHHFLIPANLVLIAYFLFVKKNKWYSIKVPAIALTSLGLMFGLKYLFGRPRPDVPLVFRAEGLSFPSGHALFSVSFYGLLIYIVYTTVRNGWIRWVLLTVLSLLLFVIGFSRVYLRVHYATDVVAGFCVGFVWLVFAIWALNRMERRSGRALAAANG